MDRESLGEGLESALLDQRMRAEKHKANFEALKAQHLTLQDAHSRQKEELTILAESYDRLAARSQEIIQTLQSERDTKIVECEELRAQVLPPVKLEQLRTQLMEEGRQEAKKRVEALEEQVDGLTRECNSLKYNYTFLKAEYENSQTTHQTVLKEMRAKHETELNAYIEERKAFLARNERDIPTDVQRIRHLQRKINDLQQKVKGLLSENEELRGEKEQVAALTEQSQQVQCQELAELRAKVKTLQVEGSAQSEQVTSLQGELTKVRQEVVSLNQQLALSHTQLDSHKRKLCDAEHQHSLAVSELKMRHLDVCRGLEEERGSCEREIKSLRAQLEAQNKSMETQDTMLADKEREVEGRVQAAREREWEKQVCLERDRIELEATVTDLQQHLSGVRGELDSHVGSLEDRLRELTTDKAGLEGELDLLRGQLEDKSRELQTVTAEVKQVSGVSRKYQLLLQDHRKLEGTVDQLRDSRSSLEEVIRELQTQLSTERQSWSRDKETLIQDHAKQGEVWSSDREGLTGRLSDCESSKTTVEQELTAAKATNKKLQKHYKKQIGELKQSIEVLKAEQETVSTEKQALQSCLGLENQRLQRKLSDILRKQKEFQFLLHSHPQTTFTHSTPHHSPEHTPENTDNQLE